MRSDNPSHGVPCATRRDDPQWDDPQRATPSGSTGGGSTSEESTGGTTTIGTTAPTLVSNAFTVPGAEQLRNGSIELNLTSPGTDGYQANASFTGKRRFAQPVASASPTPRREQAAGRPRTPKPPDP